jgi:predicted Zn-dependent peptidase
MNKKEFDKYLQFSKFLYKGEENGFTHTIIGERDDIESISVKNVIKFYRNQFVPENVLISIQSGRELLPSEIEEIEEIGAIFGKKSSERKYPNSKINQKKRIYHFKDNQIEGVSLAILFPQEYQKSLDYNSEALEYLFRSLMRKISHDYLREKLGLIYSSQISSNFSLSFKERIVGYELIMQPENFKDVLKYLDKMIGSKIETFLESKEGRVWFESAISSYIFPRNMPYKSNYAEKKGLALLEDGEVLELDKAVNEALRIDIKDVQKFSKEFFNNPAIFWIESDSEGKEFVDELEKSNLYQRF